MKSVYLTSLLPMSQMPSGFGFRAPKFDNRGFKLRKKEVEEEDEIDMGIVQRSCDDDDDDNNDDDDDNDDNDGDDDGGDDDDEDDDDADIHVDDDCSRDANEHFHAHDGRAAAAGHCRSSIGPGAAQDVHVTSMQLQHRQQQQQQQHHLHHHLQQQQQQHHHLQQQQQQQQCAPPEAPISFRSLRMRRRPN